MLLSIHAPPFCGSIMQAIVHLDVEAEGPKGHLAPAFDFLVDFPSQKYGLCYHGK